MNKLIKVFFILLIITSCTSQKKGLVTGAGAGDTRTSEIEFIDEDTYFLTVSTKDKTYGYDRSNPIKVGGSKESSGPKNERRFLNALLGPNGEEVQYYRAGICCAFKTPNGMINNTGMLDRYRIFWIGSSDTLDMFINMYDKGDLSVPVGLNAKKK
jgi:hypothetical protein